jgi:beta-xylosidase
LQENIVTTRNGRYVVPVKAEHRGDVKGLVHDTSSSGATIFVEPMAVVDANNELRVLVRDNLRFYDPLMHGVSVGKTTSVWLRVNIHELKLKFSYSLDGESFTEIGGLLDCSDLSDEAYGDIGHEGHTGTFIGMACQDLSGKNLHADFESFTYRRNI